MECWSWSRELRTSFSTLHLKGLSTTFSRLHIVFDRAALVRAVTRGADFPFVCEYSPGNAFPGPRVCLEGACGLEKSREGMRRNDDLDKVSAESKGRSV
jgi:hypothetical protein